MSYLNVFIIYWILSDSQYSKIKYKLKGILKVYYIMADKPRSINIRENTSSTYVMYILILYCL